MSNELAKQISYILYSSPEEDVKVMALVKDETIWLKQKAMAELFDVNVPGISKHLKNIYDEGELSESATVSILDIVQCFHCFFFGDEYISFIHSIHSESRFSSVIIKTIFFD